MRVYQLRHYEVMMREEDFEEARRLLYYEQLCYDMLTVQAISSSKAIEIIKLHKGKVEQRAKKIQKILSDYTIPAFYFVVSKN
jgi:adenylate kinase